MKAKLINGQLVYESDFMKIGENWVSNPTDAMLVSEGYKEVVYQTTETIEEQFTETETQIIVWQTNFTNGL